MNGHSTFLRRLFIYSFSVIFLSVGIFAVSAASHAASQPAKNNVVSYDPPKLADGTPDFRGIWQARSTAYLNIEGHPADHGVAAAKSIIVDPPDGKIPYLPDALKERDENYQKRFTSDPQTKCYESGVPRATYVQFPFQIVQSPGNFAILYQENHAFRVVYPDSRPHFEGIDWWMGDSRGHWEDKTLVVDVTDLNDNAWFDNAGNHHTDDMHVVERYTLVGPDTLQYEATMTDARTFTRPWAIRVLLYRHKEPGFRIMEDECEQNLKTAVRYHVSPVTGEKTVEKQRRQ